MIRLVMSNHCNDDKEEEEEEEEEEVGTRQDQDDNDANDANDHQHHHHHLLLHHYDHHNRHRQRHRHHRFHHANEDRQHLDMISRPRSLFALLHLSGVRLCTPSLPGKLFLQRGHLLLRMLPSVCKLSVECATLRRAPSRRVTTEIFV